MLVIGSQETVVEPESALEIFGGGSHLTSCNHFLGAKCNYAGVISSSPDFYLVLDADDLVFFMAVSGDVDLGTVFRMT